MKLGARFFAALALTATALVIGCGSSTPTSSTKTGQTACGNLTCQAGQYCNNLICENGCRRTTTAPAIRPA